MQMLSLTTRTMFTVIASSTVLACITIDSSLVVFFLSQKRSRKVLSYPEIQQQRREKKEKETEQREEVSHYLSCS